MRANKSGFTLVELMVVVAIIGVLAAIAIPNYQKYQAKARQSEAKVNLAALYTAEQGYYSEHGTFTGCLRQIGFDLNDMSNAVTKRYYSVGFSATPIASTVCGPNGGAACTGYTWNVDGTVNVTCPDTDGFFLATAKMNSALSVVVQASLTNAVVTKETFLGTAMGSISNSSGSYDTWTINQSKYINNSTVGM